MLKIHKIFNIFALFIVITVIISFFSTNIYAETPILIDADKVFYDKAKNLYIAKGKVMISDGKKYLFADEVYYYKNEAKVYARSNITVLEETGDVYFADFAVVTDNFKRGVIENFQARFVDETKITSYRTIRVDEANYVLLDASFSPCKIDKCKAQQFPQWQIRSEKAFVDNNEQTIVYRNAYFDIYGVPIFYTPYFSSPTPNAKRKSGLLTPSYGTITNIGTYLKLPYYFNLAPNYDLTLTPMLTTEGGPILIGEFRHLTKYGSYIITTSGTYPEDKRENTAGRRFEGRRFRGHVSTQGRFNFYPYWYTGFDINRQTDSTYLKEYRFSDVNFLQSRVYQEKIKDREYVSLELFSFQDLLPELNNDFTPTIWPYFTYHNEYLIGENNTKLLADASLLNLTRKIGEDVTRISGSSGLYKPVYTENGHVFELSSSVRADLYDVRNNRIYGDSHTNSSRFVPLLEMDYAYPLAKSFNKGTLFFEPVANIILSSVVNNARAIPNEDSVDVEINDYNVFNTNKFAGLDKVESGSRANYGFDTNYYDVRGYHLGMLLGQTFQSDEKRAFREGTGLNDSFSDYVGKITATTKDYGVIYKFRLKGSNFENLRNEISAYTNFWRLKLNGDYTYYKDFFSLSTKTVDTRKEIFLNATYKISDFWDVNIYGRRNLENSRFITVGGGVKYASDCMEVNALINRDYTKVGTLDSQVSFMLQVNFKNLFNLQI